MWQAERRLSTSVEFVILSIISRSRSVGIAPALHASVWTNVGAEHKVPDHLQPGRVVRQVVIKIRSDFLHLATNSITACTNDLH